MRIYIVRFHDDIHEPLPVDAVDEVGAGDEKHESTAECQHRPSRVCRQVLETRHNDKLHDNGETRRRQQHSTHDVCSLSVIDDCVIMGCMRVIVVSWQRQTIIRF